VLLERQLNRTDWILLLGGAGLAVAGVAYWTRTKPRSSSLVSLQVPTATVVSPGTLLDPSFLNPPGLPDPSTVMPGTISPDGKWIVSQSRQRDSVPRWEPLMLGGVFG
jgi:hypothetical protein